MTTKKQLLKVIRSQCLECMGGVTSEIDLCTDLDCPLYTFRAGTDPKPSRKRQGLAPKKKK